MDMEDEKGGDAKLIAVVANEPRTYSITDIQHVPSHVRKAEASGSFTLHSWPQVGLKLRAAPNSQPCTHQARQIDRGGLCVRDR